MTVTAIANLDSLASNGMPTKPHQDQDALAQENQEQTAAAMKQLPPQHPSLLVSLCSLLLTEMTQTLVCFVKVIVVTVTLIAKQDSPV